MKKVFETPAIEIFRMQVSEDLTLSDDFQSITSLDGRIMFKARTSVENWTN